MQTCMRAWTDTHHSPPRINAGPSCSFNVFALPSLVHHIRATFVLDPRVFLSRLVMFGHVWSRLVTFGYVLRRCLLQLLLPFFSSLLQETLWNIISYIYTSNLCSKNTFLLQPLQHRPEASASAARLDSFAADSFGEEYAYIPGAHSAAAGRCCRCMHGLHFHPHFGRLHARQLCGAAGGGVDVCVWSKGGGDDAPPIEASVRGGQCVWGCLCQWRVNLPLSLSVNF